MTWFSLIASFFGSTTLATIVSYFVFRPKNKAETIKAYAEVRQIVTETSEKIFDQVNEQNDRLSERIEALEKEREESTATIRALNALLWQAGTWQRRVYAVLTTAQKVEVGEPPNIDVTAL